MSDDVEIGYAKPPRSTRWQKGQSGNPKGRPRTRSEDLQDAARILTQPVEARAPDGKTIKLDGIEAAYLSLCKKGLKGHKTSLLEAIRIMLEVGAKIKGREEYERRSRREILEYFERLGVKLSPGFRLRD